MSIVKVVERRQIRYAHMIGVNAEIMQEGMRADYKMVDRLSDKLRERMLKAEASFKVTKNRLARIAIPRLRVRLGQRAVNVRKKFRAIRAKIVARARLDQAFERTLVHQPLIDLFAHVCGNAIFAEAPARVSSR